MATSARLEDYLETIFSIEITGKDPTVTEIAEKLELTKGTVATGVKKLAKTVMLEHEPYGSVHLTDTGRQRALTIYRRHKNISFIFSEMFGFPHELADSLACLVEHEIDEKGEQKIFALTEFICHNRRKGAEWIQELDEELKKEYALPKPLVMTVKNEVSEVVRLTCEPALRSRLLGMGLVPGTPLTTKGIEPAGGAVEIKIKEKDISLKRNEATSVWVRPVQNGSSEDGKDNLTCI